MVVILAAGKGSRMILPTQPDDMSKCAININAQTDKEEETTVTRLIKQFYIAGEENFTIIVGFGAKYVTDAVNKIIKKSTNKYSKLNITYIYNPHYDDLGCEYSLSLSADLMSSTDDVIIVEGDLITSQDNIDRMVHYNGSGVLTREGCYASRKSVIVPVYSSVFVSEFVYDPTHETDFLEWNRLLTFVESMQIWKFVDDHCHLLARKLNDYKMNAEIQDDEEYKLASGLLSINQVVKSINDFRTIPAVDTDAWMNLNTSEDLNKLSTEVWYE